MIQYLNVFFYDIYPYICATVFFLGSWLRYDYGQYTWRASSSQMLDKRGMVIWSNLFHTCEGVRFRKLHDLANIAGRKTSRDYRKAQR